MENQTTSFPIRIGHVLGKMNGGGVEAMVMNYYRHIDKSKIQFDFIVDRDSTHVPRTEIRELGGRIFEIPPYQQVYNYNRELTALFKENRYQIVHSHINALSVFPLNAAKKAGVPIRIAHSHSTSVPGETAKNIIKNSLRPFSKVYPTHYCSCSRSAGEWLFGKGVMQTSRLNIVNNGIAVETFLFDKQERLSVRKELGLSGKFVIGHTGRLCFQKNQEFLLRLLAESLEKVPEAVLLLLGDGPDQTKLIKLAEDLGVTAKILFLGNQSDVHRYYHAMDVFAFPSRYEGFGISAIEAQASGLPVLLSDKVPKEACLTEKCEVLSIEEGVNPWLEMMLTVREDAVRDLPVEFRAYDIKSNALTLKEYYFRIIKESVSI